MAGGPERNGQGWTAADVETLRQLAAEGLGAAAIADCMGRTRSGIVKKAGSEGLSLDPFKRRGEAASMAGDCGVWRPPAHACYDGPRPTGADVSEESVEQLRDERSDLLVRVSLLEQQGLAQTDECFAARKRLQFVDARLKASRISISGDSYKPRRRTP
jgi:hypothetical protein